MIGRPHTGVNQLSFFSVGRMFSQKPTSQKDLFWELESDFRATVVYKVRKDNRGPEVKLYFPEKVTFPVINS